MPFILKILFFCLPFLLVIAYFIYQELINLSKRNAFQFDFISKKLDKLLTWHTTCYRLVEKNTQLDQHLSDNCLSTLKSIQLRLKNTINNNHRYINPIQKKYLNKITQVNDRLVCSFEMVFQQEKQKLQNRLDVLTQIESDFDYLQGLIGDYQALKHSKLISSIHYSFQPSLIDKQIAQPIEFQQNRRNADKIN